jgi:hypothetical protein
MTTGLAPARPAATVPDTRPEAGSARGGWRFAATVTAAFGVLLAVALVLHDPWRDELQAWAIVRHSSTPWALLDHLR